MRRIYCARGEAPEPRRTWLPGRPVEALRRWKAAYQPDAEPTDHVFAENGVPINVEHLADQVRNDLRRVGVTRPQLFESSETRQRFRAHDLRATFVTIALATGKTETWVSDRTGHDGHTMIDKYRRKARTWNLGELGRLYELIPELCTTEPSARITTRIPHEITARVAKLADAADLGSELTDVDSAETEKTSPIGDPRRPENGVLHPGKGQSGGNQETLATLEDQVELELARALGKAAAAARFDVVAQLAKELEARRLARLTNVIKLDATRRPRDGR